MDPKLAALIGFLLVPLACMAIERLWPPIRSQPTLRPGMLSDVTWYVVVVFLHCNVGWTFGPLRYLVVSPAFHRWHHTMEEEGRDKNFAGILPIWDLLFGTFYMPDRAPTTFGTSDPVPDGFVRQLAHPVLPDLSGANRRPTEEPPTRSVYNNGP